MQVADQAGLRLPTQLQGVGGPVLKNNEVEVLLAHAFHGLLQEVINAVVIVSVPMNKPMNMLPDLCQQARRVNKLVMVHLRLHLTAPLCLRMTDAEHRYVVQSVPVIIVQIVVNQRFNRPALYGRHRQYSRSQNGYFHEYLLSQKCSTSPPSPLLPSRVKGGTHGRNGYKVTKYFENSGTNCKLHVISLGTRFQMKGEESV